MNPERLLLAEKPTGSDKWYRLVSSSTSSRWEIVLQVHHLLWEDGGLEDNRERKVGFDDQGIWVTQIVLTEYHKVMYEDLWFFN